MVLAQWGLTSKYQRLFFYEPLVLNSADSFQNYPTAAMPEPLCVLVFQPYSQKELRQIQRLTKIHDTNAPARCHHVH
ncbi:MAG: hypothetical protein JWM28_3152 [Chitinophagaceae bacterium]|nr:hypothetical protein [Chitinophagaceae bacterium]